MTRILVVDDEKRMRHLLSIMLKNKGHRVDEAGNGLDALEKLKSTPYDMVISDIKMPKMDGIQLLKESKNLNILCPFVFITAFATVESAVNAMQKGATDYITKPFEEDRIHLTVERTLKISQILAENRDLKQELAKMVGADKVIYKSKVMAHIIALASKVARSDSAVLIRGESGTGKEVLSRFIHQNSERSQSKFVPINCAAISPQLVESELFGHEKGAFTGADKRTQGKFEYASTGTLFLDEIGDLPLESQAKLLRALQEKKVQRVGGNQEFDVDVRIICATNQNLEDFVNKGLFRQDLFFRINVFPIQMPSVRERKEDILPLATYFLNKMEQSKGMTFTDGAIRVLNEYPWPGNVRELANAIERSVILATGEKSITAETLSFLRNYGANNVGCTDMKLPPEGLSLEALQKEFVNQALAMTNNNQTNAAKLLGLTRAKFRVLMKQAMEI